MPCEDPTKSPAVSERDEIIRKLYEDMDASPVDDITVIDRQQLAILARLATPAPRNANETGQDEVLREALSDIAGQADTSAQIHECPDCQQMGLTARAALATQPAAGSEEKP